MNQVIVVIMKKNKRDSSNDENENYCKLLWGVYNNELKMSYKSKKAWEIDTIFYIKMSLYCTINLTIERWVQSCQSIAHLGERVIYSCSKVLGTVNQNVSSK